MSYKTIESIGKKGEEFAEKYLRQKGYKFIARNYWSDHGEIDLIFYKHFKLIFVEVKTRSSNDFGRGREAVDLSKQKNIKYTSKDFIRNHCVKNKAPYYLWKIPLYLKFFKVRYDVIEISSENGYKVDSHLIDFFK